MEGFTIIDTVWRTCWEIIDKEGWEISLSVDRRFHLLSLKRLFIFLLRCLNAEDFFEVVSESSYNYRL